MKSACLTIGVIAVFATGCGSGTDAPAEAPPAEAAAPVATVLPGNIMTERGGFIPEGVEYDTNAGRFLTGSLSEGTIFEIRTDGSVVPVVTDPDLISSVGIEADESRDRLLVANADRSVFESGGAGIAQLGVYTLSTGERLAMVDLAATIADAPADAVHFANDVAVGDDGTAYVTDTRMAVVYQVSPTYEASVLTRFDATEGPNGIVYHSSGYLLVASGATLWKVPLDMPGMPVAVTLPEEIPGQDGLFWTADGALAIVSNSGNRVVKLTSDDDWATAQLAGVAAYEMQATTGAAVGEDVYVVHPHFADADPPSLERVTFE